MGARGGYSRSFKYVAMNCLASIIAAASMLFLRMLTLADAQVRSSHGSGQAWCGNSYAYMIDSRVEKVFGIPHECVSQSRIAMAIIIAAAILVLIAERWLLRRFVSSKRRVSKESTAARTTA
ncbi:hypothetical protein SAMN05216246_104113 [Actinomyces denticolens]|uniref:Uncharacterized protein n=2 Tax=Actinomycetaceae TaxID=2049 RepID=A0ABY1I7B8_9ACTO|nr:hypothetical protein SAMN05216246_104113 [Actinomyces denticolens]